MLIKKFKKKKASKRGAEKRGRDQKQTDGEKCVKLLEAAVTVLIASSSEHRQ